MRRSKLTVWAAWAVGALLFGTLVYSQGKPPAPRVGPGGVAVAAQNGTADGGVALSIGEFETTGRLDLYVDSPGNDSNACTGPGASACASIAGACSKIPKVVRDPVFVNIDGGNWFGAHCVGYDFSQPHSVDAGAYIYFKGEALQFANTGDGGTLGVVGMANSCTGSSGTYGFGTITEKNDGGTGWTTDALKTYWVEILTGTAAGTRRLIMSNTASTITTDGTITACANGDTFAIRDFATRVTAGPMLPAGAGGVAAALPTLMLVGATGSGNRIWGTSSTNNGGNFFFEDIDFQAPSNGVAFSVMGPASDVTLNRCALRAATTGTAFGSNGNTAGMSWSRLAFATSLIQGGTGILFRTNYTHLVNASPTIYFQTGTYIQSANTSAANHALALGTSTNFSNSLVELTAASGNSSAIQVLAPYGELSFGSGAIKCNPAANQNGIVNNDTGPGNSGTGNGKGNVAFAGGTIDGCWNGYVAAGPTRTMEASGGTIQYSANSVQLARGAKWFNTFATTTITNVQDGGATNEVLLDSDPWTLAQIKGTGDAGFLSSTGTPLDAGGNGTGTPQYVCNGLGTCFYAD